MNGWLFWGIATAMSIALFFNGRRFARMTRNPWAGRNVLGQPVEGADAPIEAVQRLGRIQMMGAPLVWILFTLLSFGVLGPVAGIDTILR